MTCTTYRFHYPFVGTAQRALLNHMNTCGVFLVSHISPGILRLVEKIAAKRKARYLVVYAVLTGSLDYRPVHGLYINASHHEKYYLVDGTVLAKGSANLTESEFDDKTLNDLALHICAEPEELEELEDYQAMTRMLKIALRDASINMEDIAHFLSGTSCARVLQEL